jgi:hypothetical protein
MSANASRSFGHGAVADRLPAFMWVMRLIGKGEAAAGARFSFVRRRAMADLHFSAHNGYGSDLRAGHRTRIVAFLETP